MTFNRDTSYVDISVWMVHLDNGNDVADDDDEDYGDNDDDDEYFE